MSGVYHSFISRSHSTENNKQQQQQMHFLRSNDDNYSDIFHMVFMTDDSLPRCVWKGLITDIPWTYADLGHMQSRTKVMRQMLNLSILF